MFNTYGVTDEYNAPTEAISEEAGGESEYSEKERKPYEASNNSGKEPGFSFPDMGFFAFIFMYLVQYFSVGVTKNLASFGMVLTNPILSFVSTFFDHSSRNRPIFV